MMRRVLYIVILIFLFMSITVQAAPIAPYVILEAEHGDLIGRSLSIVHENNLQYVTISGKGNGDLLSQPLDIEVELHYETGCI